MICAAIANSVRGKKSRPVKVADYLPRWDSKGRQEQSWEEQLAAIRTVHATVTATTAWKQRKGASHVDDRHPPREARG